MSWSIISVLIALFIYVLYNTIAIKLFWIPPSLSDTYYLYKKKNPWMRIFFPIMMVALVILLMPAWLEISVGSSLQFLAFLAAGSILFVGAAPAFKQGGIEFRVHSTSAYCAAAFALLWVFFVSKLWWTVLIWFVLVLISAILTKTIKTSMVYWLETIAFMSTFTALILFFFI